MVLIMLFVFDGVLWDGCVLCVVVGYGGFCIIVYGNCFNFEFKVFLDWGIIWVIVYICGGGELGFSWYE